MTTTTSMRGYTLLEMIVAVGIFSIIMLIVTGAYLSLIALDREVRASTSLVTNLSFGMDSMARSIRTGIAYGCGSSGGNVDNPSAGNNGECTSFSFYDTMLGRKVTYIRKDDGTLGRCTGNSLCTSSSALSLTDPNVIIESDGLRFYVRGVGLSGALGDVQPQVTVTVRGIMEGSNGRETSFAIQTSATQRLIEI